MRRLLVTLALTTLLVALWFKDIQTEADVFYFCCGVILLVSAIIVLTITSYAKTEDNNRLNKHQ